MPTRDEIHDEKAKVLTDIWLIEARMTRQRKEGRYYAHKAAHFINVDSGADNEVRKRAEAYIQARAEYDDAITRYGKLNAALGNRHT